MHKPNETITILETESHGGLLELECYNAAYWDRNAWDHNGTMWMVDCVTQLI